MNSADRAPVEAPVKRARWTRTLATITAVLTSAIGCTACVDVEGGAAELSWSLRTFAGEPIDGEPADECRGMGIADVRLKWRSAAPPDGGALDAERIDGTLSFACASSRGVTAFTIDEGVQAFWIEPLCEGGQPPAAGTFQVPPPILRQITRGNVVNLNAWLIVAYPRCTAAGDTSCRPEMVTCPAPALTTDIHGN